MAKLDVRYPEIGKLIKAAMAAKGVDIRTTAKATEISYESVRRYGAGISKPRANALDSLARYLGTTEAHLLGENTTLSAVKSDSPEQTPTREQVERLSEHLRKLHPNGFSLTVMQPINGGLWSRRPDVAKETNAPRYFVILGSSIDEIIDSLV
jgi:transcriptional regulator with XRE-family HTH domain